MKMSKRVAVAVIEGELHRAVINPMPKGMLTAEDGAMANFTEYVMRLNRAKILMAMRTLLREVK